MGFVPRGGTRCAAPLSPALAPRRALAAGWISRRPPLPPPTLAPLRPAPRCRGLPLDRSPDFFAALPTPRIPRPSNLHLFLIRLHPLGSIIMVLPLRYGRGAAVAVRHVRGSSQASNFLRWPTVRLGALVPLRSGRAAAGAGGGSGFGPRGGRGRRRSRSGATFSVYIIVTRSSRLGLRGMHLLLLLLLLLMNVGPLMSLRSRRAAAGAGGRRRWCRRLRSSPTFSIYITATRSSRSGS